MTVSKFKKVFTSNDQFAQLLVDAGAEVPMKKSNTSGEPIPAFAFGSGTRASFAERMTPSVPSDPTMSFVRSNGRPGFTNSSRL